MSRNKFKGTAAKSIGGQFLKLPYVVLKSNAYRALSHPARSLLMDIAMQFAGHNNGSLVACKKYLLPLGWSSADTVSRATKELVNRGLLMETRKGARPNKAAWFALAWLDLDIQTGLDIDPRRYVRGSFVRDGGYQQFCGQGIT
jgi:hypothetical protein